MTDPVDTDALRDLAVTIEEVFRGEPYDANPGAIDEPALIRAAADEVDRLRAELDAWEPAWRNMRGERDKARALLDAAPHSEYCQMSYLSTHPSARCTCWKADVL